MRLLLLLPAAGLLVVAGCDGARPPGRRPLQPAAPQLVLEPPAATPLHLDEVRRFACGLTGLRGVAVGPEDRLLLVGDGQVQVLDRAGAQEARWPAGGPVRCVAATAEGEVILGYESTVAMHDLSGERLRAWGEAGRERGQLRLVTGLAVHGSNVLVADAGNRRVLRFDLRGDFVGDLGDLVCPSPYLGVAVGPDGILHVPNPGQLRVERYRLDGERLGQWGEAGVAPEQFPGCCNPIDLAVLADGRIAVAEKTPSRVKLYDATGALLAYLGPEHFPGDTPGLDLAVDRHGLLMVANPGDRIVRVYAVEED
jgi:hypothetical protein